MGCETCGEKPKKCGSCNKGFPRAVIEINNPEALVLLRKVVIPASMGTEEQVPAAIGKYKNVILQYESNGHVYLYSSDGIPTAITNTSSIPLAQNTGTSTVEAMSQNAVSSAIFGNPGEDTIIKIGKETLATGDSSTAIGHGAVADGDNSVVVGLLAFSAGNATGSISVGHGANCNSVNGIAIGRSVATSGSDSISIGSNAVSTATGSVALGDGSRATKVGEVNVGSSVTSHGYDNTKYRIISGVHDPQGANDAATKGYCDARIINGGTTAPTTSTVGAVGTLCSTVESGTGHLYICTDDTGGAYTWQTLV